MGTQNTRINIDADTSRAKQALRELSDEAKKYNIDASKASMGDINEVKKVIEQIRKEKQNAIKDEYNSSRRDASSDYTQAKREFSSGKINEGEFEKRQKNYQENFNTHGQERSELRDEYNKSNTLLEQILKQFQSESKQDDANSQRDSREFGGSGNNGGGLSNLSKAGSEGATRVFVVNWPDEFGSNSSSSDSSSRRNRNSSNDDEDKKNDKLARKIVGYTKAVESFKGGDFIGAGSSILMSSGNPFTAGAGAIMALGNLAMSQMSALSKMQAPIFSMRAQGSKEQNFADIDSRNFRTYEFHVEDVLSNQANVMKTSGFGGGDSMGRALNSMYLEKGYGIDNMIGNSINESSYSENKKGQTTTISDNVVELLNTLSRIEGSTITATDLTNANQKFATMMNIQGRFKESQEFFNSTNVIRTQAAFEKIGSGKISAHGQDSFSSGFLSNARESGDQNKKLFQLQAAQEAHPELAGDWAALSEIVEKGTDSSYLASFKKMGTRMGGPNKQTSYGFGKWLYSGMNADQRSVLMDKENNDSFSNEILGKMSTGSGPFSISDAQTAAGNNTSNSESIQVAQQNASILAVDYFLVKLKGFFGGDVIVPIKDMTPKVAQSSKNTVPGNG